MFTGAVDMRTKLQPIVGIGQQLIRSAAWHKIQLMVAVTDKAEIKRLFSERLNGLLDEVDAPTRGRSQWLSRTFNGAFSKEAARKWLEAASIPDQAHISMLCTYFQWGGEYLLTGNGPRYIPHDVLTSRMIEDLARLNETDRAHAARTIELLLENAKPDPEPPPPPRPARHPIPPKRRS